MTDAAAVLRLRYADAATARLVNEALDVDDDAFCKTRAEGPFVVAEVRGRDARSLLRAADDFLACAAVAEDVIKTRSIGRQNA